jgi:hypothetical protein
MNEVTHPKRMLSKNTPKKAAPRSAPALLAKATYTLPKFTSHATANTLKAAPKRLFRTSQFGTINPQKETLKNDGHRIQSFVFLFD